jgi:hypothetical protein
MLGDMIGKNIFPVLAIALAGLAAAPVLAQGKNETQTRKETCLEVSLDGDYKFKIPCPQGTRQLLEKFPRPTEPAPRRKLVIDPKWPHDQAMAAELDWPHDRAMIAPQDGEVEPAIPLFDELLGALERDVRESKVRQLLEDWLPGKSR